MDAETIQPRGRARIGSLTLLGAALILGAGGALGWDAIAFRAIGHLFYEASPLAALREPSQVALVRWHLRILAGVLAGLGIAWPFVSAHARRWWLVLLLAYAIRASIWIAGSNLPLVPGDSAHYVEVATSILRGEGPVKHYVESFFRDYPAIRRGEGALDDWATPLFAYALAWSYRLCGVEPGGSIEATFAVGKGLSFALNLLTLPAVYVFARRRLGPRLALASMAVLAVLPVHALYAGFELRESLVALMSVLAVGLLVESWSSEGERRYVCALASGLFLGLAILSRNTAMALAAACGLHGLLASRGRFVGPTLACGLVAAFVIAPWALITYREYGAPFYSYTQYFAYNFSWTVHHLHGEGNTRASQFYTAANAPEIVRVKVKSAVIVVVYSTMILGLPLMAGFLRRLGRGRDAADGLVALVAALFVAGTLAQIADVTQVAQLGRYYLPVFVLMVPTAVAGLASPFARRHDRRLLAASLVALLWADPTWAYDFSWLSKTYQLHWPALRAAGDWVRTHPEDVPPSARILTWFPWEFRLASRRTTILMNRSLYPPHLRRTIRQYGVTHVLWGSFEPPPEIDPEPWGASLSSVRASLGLSRANELYRGPPGPPIATYPVAIYRIAEAAP